MNKDPFARIVLPFAATTLLLGVAACGSEREPDLLYGTADVVDTLSSHQEEFTLVEKETVGDSTYKVWWMNDGSLILTINDLAYRTITCEDGVPIVRDAETGEALIELVPENCEPDDTITFETADDLFDLASGNVNLFFN